MPQGGRIAGKYSDEQVKYMVKANYKVFAIAIFASLIWHVFWISTIKIVSDSASGRAVRFSKVSFLGPLLGGSAIDLQVRPRQRTFLEDRYLAMAKRPAQEGRLCARADLAGYDAPNDAYHLKNDVMPASIDEAFGADKMEPSALDE